jgi:hypothetical protein
MSSVILAKATGAGNSIDFTVSAFPMTVRVYPKANLATEVGYLKQKNPDGTYDDVYDLSGTVIALGATMPQVYIVGPGTYRVEFAARTSAIGADVTVKSTLA